MKRKITDAVKIIDRHFGGDTEWDRMTAEEELDARIGQVAYELRERAQLTQAELAAMVGATQPVISKVENADYEGSAVEMLLRICHALGHKVRISCPRRTKNPRCNIAVT